MCQMLLSNLPIDEICIEISKRIQQISSQAFHFNPVICFCSVHLSRMSISSTGVRKRVQTNSYQIQFSFYYFTRVSIDKFTMVRFMQQFQSKIYWPIRTKQAATEEYAYREHLVKIKKTLLNYRDVDV